MHRLVLVATLSLAACQLISSEAYSLAGTWELKKGRALENATGSPEKIELPAPIYRHPALSEYEGWITLRRVLPAGADHLLARGLPVALNIGYLSDVSRVYLDNELVASFGNDQPYESGHNRHLLKTLPHHMRNSSSITIELYAGKQYPFMISGPDLEMGWADEVFAHFFIRETINIAVLVIYLVVGIYHLLLARYHRAELYPLYFGLFSITAVVYWFSSINTALHEFVFASHVLLRNRMDLISLFLLPVPFFFFLSQLFYGRHSRMGMIYAVAAFALSLLVLFSPHELILQYLSAWQILALFLVPYMLFYTIKAARVSREARFFLAVIVLMALSVVHDILQARNWLSTQPLTRYLFLLFIPANAIFLAARAARTRQLLERLTRTLEDRVLERTEELAQTLSTINELKIAQDCDYFLTTRLYRPLAQLSASPKHCHISAHLEQYKKFKFRKWSEELGGDILITANLTLDAQHKIVILAGDAMGKSMQGAGGAIVLGSVFHSILDRTRVSLSARNYQPDRWLISTIHLLHSVFLSFNGSMLVSIFLAIFDEESKRLFFINADHPPAALLRDGKASYIEGSLHRKLGIDLQLPFQVTETTLQKGDIVFLGSDGRDNVAFVSGQERDRTINEDPEFFLKHLQNSQGDLKRLVFAIKASGELIDDLSLLRLEVH